MIEMIETTDGGRRRQQPYFQGGQRNLFREVRIYAQEHSAFTKAKRIGGAHFHRRQATCDK
jgi:hypothetical protein